MVPRLDETPLRVPQAPLKIWVRAALLAVAGGIIAVFVVAHRLSPYDSAGQPLRMAAHEQLGLPPCHFVRYVGRPCPTCGMTTSFALLMKGDLAASWRANCAGTLFAFWLMVLVPWGAISAVRGHWLFGRKVEYWLLGGIIGTVLIALLRWIIVVGVPWLLGWG